MNNKYITFLVFLATISILLFSCKTEEPIVSELLIISPDNITEHVLNPETSYSFGINDYNCDSIIFSADLIKKDGTTYNISYSNSELLMVQFKSDTVPDEQWERKVIDNKYVKGLITCYSFAGKTPKDTAYYEFYIPFRPTVPKVTLLNNDDNENGMTATFSFYADGVKSYKINYAAFGEASGNVVDIDDATQTTYTLTNLDRAKKYSVFVQAINDSGVTGSETIGIGSTYTSASCVLSRNGNDVKYQIKVGETILDDLEIISAGIYDTNNILKIEVPAKVNEYFSIASLAGGVYTLKVQVKDYGLCGKTFFK